MLDSPSASAARMAHAGHSGEGVRSDCRITIEPMSNGGIVMELKSRVACYYGDSIRKTVGEILSNFHILHARVLIDDEGALPFALAARTEAAIRQAGYSGKPLAIEVAPRKARSARDRMRRSRLYLPGSEPKYFINAGLHGPDAVILDLEDSVHPDDKFASRLLVRNALSAVDFGKAERMVRVNQLPMALEDLEEIVPQCPDLILIPKVETAQQIQETDRFLSALERQHGITDKIWLMPILESALGIENAFAIALASDRNVALTIGLEDYTADLGVVKTAEGAESFYARARVVNAARAAGLQAIDSVYGNVGNLEGLKSWGEASRAMGFEGMGCVHPSQIEVIHRAFSPSIAELERAMKIVSAFKEAEVQGRAVVSIGSKMIDPPVVHRAMKVVERARALGIEVPDGVKSR